MAVAGERLKPAVRQFFREGLLLLGGNLALVTTQQQDRGVDCRKYVDGIDILEATMHRCRDRGRRPIHFLYNPILQRGVGVLQIQPVAKRLAAPTAGTMRQHRGASVIAIQRIDSPDPIRDA